MAFSLDRLRVEAVSHSLFRPTTMKAAIDRLGFVQADPIRAPARAHDLILRHRVKGYRAGDLENRYPSLDIEEDYLYAYGFLPRSIWQLLHPRAKSGLSALEKRVYAAVRELGGTHPRHLEARFGRERVINAWGGYSKATTSALEVLHYRGLLRIARRENGIRVYEVAPPVAEKLSTRERLKRLILVVANILSPVQERTLQSNILRYRRLGDPRGALRDLLHSGELEKEIVDGVSYIRTPVAKRIDPPQGVRLLAPFDPLVWDRRRFEHLWGWAYRFEAYTPVAKRVRGYYALPLLWRDQIIGWANASLVDGKLNVETGFVDGKPPAEGSFREELDAEIGWFRNFLLS
jgi:uncharacterized protein YcaQ